jgi:hypothetical protein
MSVMPYPARPRREPLPEFAGRRGRWLPPGSTIRLTQFVVKQYNDGRSLREISELVDRSHREVANILHAVGVPRRQVGAARLPGSRRRTTTVSPSSRALHEVATKVATTPRSPE